MYTYKTLIRDKLVDNATFKGLFNATYTGSCRVNMENLVVSAAYPQVIISYGGGATMAGMDVDNATMFLTVECRGTSTFHAHKEIGNFRSAILNIVDDTGFFGVSGAPIASPKTGVCHWFKKFSEVEGFSEDKKVWWLRMGFAGNFVQNASYP